MAAVLRCINHLLGMLDPHTHRKGLCFQWHTNLLQIFESISCAVTDGKNSTITGYRLVMVNDKPSKCSTCLLNACYLGVKTHFAAKGNDSLADILHHCQQHICAHMGFGIKEDIFPCTRFHKLLQDPADTWVIHTGVQLTVRKCTGAALTELDITFRIKLSGFPEFLHLFVTGLGIIATLQNQRTQAGNRQHQCRKHTGRTEAYNHRSGFGFFDTPGYFVILIVCQRCPFAT